MVKKTDTPEGAGREYTQRAGATENTNGKASATAAGGDPVNSPVIGNPGENRPDMGYDYGLAAAPQASAPLASAEVLAAKAAPDARDQEIALLKAQLAAAYTGTAPVATAAATPAEPVDYAELVRARQKGHYDGLREKGDVFNNDKNLPTYPEDPNSWFEDADRDPEWEIKAQSAGRRKSR